MAKSGKETQASLAKQLIAGANKHFPDASVTLTIGGASYTVSQLTTLLQSFVDLRAASDAAKVAAKAKLVAERAQTPSLSGVISAFVKYVRATFGDSADSLADFGLSAPKARTPISAEQQTVAVAKRKATRAARHTMGSQQKKGVKGTVEVTVTTTPLPATPAVVTSGGSTAATAGGTSTPHA
jgi:hypothetical protein